MTLSREVKGQRDKRGRSLEFMMRLESRFRLSEGGREINNVYIMYLKFV